jgi:hypothetical protein
MITPSYAITATERVLPRLALDFTTGVLDPRVTITRALNTATRVNSSGFIETVNADLPRFDYDRATLLPKGMLIEETRQNLVLQSANLANATNWTPAGVGVGLTPVVTSNAGVSPTGSNDAVRIQFDCTDIASATNRSRITQTITIVNGTTYSRGMWIKAYDANSVGKTIRFATDSIGTNLIYTLTDQWVRINPASAAASSTSTVFTIETRGTLTTQTADVLVWNATLEAGAFLTSDIPTTTTSLTRNADAVSMTGTNFSDWYNATEGTFMVQGIPTTTASSGALSIDDGTGNERMQMRALGGGGQALVVDGGSTQINLPTGTWPTGSSGKCVLAYKASSFACAVGGDTPATSTSGTLPTVTQMQIGGGINQSYFNGRVQKIGYWPQRCINNEVRAFSKG